MKPSAAQLIEIFSEAKTRPAGPARETFLAGACAGDSKLKEQVLSLLKADEKAGDFLRKTPETPELAVTTESPGTKIGRYKLLQVIGEGGCGIVYMAEQEEPVRRRVALKIIKLGMDTRQVVARFEAERQALALMDHPNIAKVLDAGATQTGRPFFVMELVRGIKITDYCDQNHLTTAERLALFIQVCQAIQHAHQKGVIHRDIKPSNVLVAQHDSVAVPKVIDFGIAKATNGQQLTDKTVFTAFEQFMGTPAYMSPEQAQLSGLDIDTRTDIYALGVLLYELLTGRTPFDQKELLSSGLDEMRRTIREKEPLRPSTRLSTLLQVELQTTASRRQTEPPKLIHLVRGDLDWIVLKCLEKDRVRRYETANGLARDLERHLRNELVTARPPSNWYRFQKLVRRNRLAFAGTAVVTAALLLTLVVLGISNVRITRETNEKDAALKEKDSALMAARTSERRAKEELFVSLRSQARARRLSRQMGQRLDSLAAVSEAARIKADPSLRDDAIAAMALSDIRLGPKWPVWQTNCVALACDATYGRYAVLDSRDGLTVRNIADGAEILRLEIGTPKATSTFLSFSPDGRFLAKVQEGEAAQVWRLETGIAILRDAPNSLRPPAFSADNQLIALPDEDSIRCFDLATGTEQSRSTTAGRIHSLQFNPRGRQIAVGYVKQPHVSLYDATDGRELARFPIGTNIYAVVCWHPEGNLLAVGDSEGRIQLWDVEARRKSATLEGHAQQVSQLTFHPDGRVLASSSWEGVVGLWDLATGRETMQIPLFAELQFSKDGQRFGFLWSDEGHAQLLELTASQEYFTLENSPRRDRTACYFCAPSPDHQLVAGATGDGIRLWDLHSHREIALLPSDITATVAFESDGRAMLTCSSQAGLLRWPIHQSGMNAADLVIGPPQQIEVPFAPQRLAWSRDTKTLAILSEAEGKAAVLSSRNQSTSRVVVEHPDVSFAALSPDAKWLATSGWHSSRVRLWNAQDGKLVWERAVGVQTRVSFTPDGRQLIIGRAGEFSFLGIGTLEIERRLRREAGLYPGDVAFSPDDKLMALEMAPGVIHLKDAANDRTVAQLEDPSADRSSWIAFAPDGTKLIVVSTYASAVHVWDLRAIRTRLKSLGLDWDWPEFPPSETPNAASERDPMKVHVISADAR